MNRKQRRFKQKQRRIAGRQATKIVKALESETPPTAADPKVVEPPIETPEHTEAKATDRASGSLGSLIGTRELENEGAKSKYRQFGVTLISSGVTKTPSTATHKKHYTESALQRAIESGVYDGLRMMAHTVSDYGGHKKSRAAKSTNDICGFISNPVFEDGRIRAIANVLESSGKIAGLMEASITAPRALVELSVDHDIMCADRPRNGVLDVVDIPFADSVDIVFAANAGGRVSAALESLAPQENDMLKIKKLLQLFALQGNEKAKEYLGKIDWEKDDDPLLAEATTFVDDFDISTLPPAGSDTDPTPPTPDPVAPAPVAPVAAAPATDPVAPIPPPVDVEAAVQAAVEARMRPLDLQRTQGAVMRATEGLPDSAKTYIQKELEGQILTDAEVTTKVGGFKGLMASLNPNFAPTGGASAVTVGEFDKHRQAMHGLFVGRAIEGQAPFRSLHQAYAHITGDRSDLDLTAGRKIWGALKTLPYDVPFDELVSRQAQEGVIGGPPTFAVALGDALNVAMLESFNFGYALPWRNGENQLGDLIKEEDIRDFHSQNITHIGSYDPADVAQVNDQTSDDNAFLLATNPTEEAGSYDPATRGLVTFFTKIAIFNDRVNEFGQTPRKLGEIASLSLHNLIFNTLLASNANALDGAANFLAAHNNFQPSTTLNEDTANQAYVDFATQTDVGTAGVELGLLPTHCFVPPHLVRTATAIFGNKTITGFQAGTPEDALVATRSFIGEMGIRTIMIPAMAKNINAVGGATNGNTYAMLGSAKPGHPGIVIGFVGGQRSPRILRADAGEVPYTAVAGATSNHRDRLYMKLDWDYGARITDHRVWQGIGGGATWAAP